ncbi:bifunctional 2-C-methyl-D-erythritol 4-phosphate cytidylyltransferase/2-C-methyl-D-erythritol 2,4-cyclodiphosphate synthase [Hirschia litorea]|uniref:Bifunctional enzyme IspD/IspF n=1 Tax=Hirschia litorea TaxID=1199156 RepID=A0ABW2IHF6_9PROT
MTQYAAIIVAAGIGQRAGLSSPKQFAELNGQAVIDWSLKSFAKSGIFEKTIVVLSPTRMEYGDLLLERFPNIIIVEGGSERADSVRNALDYLNKSDPPDFVFIHDAARPGLSQTVINRLLTALEDCDGAAPFLPIIDAVKVVERDNELRNVDRSTLHRIQTPQAFRFSAIFDANNGKNISFVDDLEAVQSIGMKIKLVEGETQLMKITLPEDFKIVSSLLPNEEDTPIAFPRIGSGFDVHAFENGNGVTLCGVFLPHHQKLKGHSDADVAWHAITDAIYGALAAGDIGTHFPPTDPQWKGTNSAVFLAHASQLVASKGFQIANVDLTIICESPKIKPHADAMQKITADILKIDVDQVSIKATTTELLGFTGRKEGIAAQASVLLMPLV